MGQMKRLPLIPGRDFFVEAEQALYPGQDPRTFTKPQREAVTAHAKERFAEETGHRIP